jgi:uncharacterized protein YqeY
MRERIAAALKDSMKAQDATRTATLRLVVAALKDREIAARDDADEARDDEAEVVAVLAKMVKQRQESIRAYEEGGRLDLAAREEAEIAVIREFLPKPLSPAEIEAAVAAAMAETGAGSIRDMGRVIGALKARYPGRMDFGKVGAQVKAALGAAGG